MAGGVGNRKRKLTIEREGGLESYKRPANARGDCEGLIEPLGLLLENTGFNLDASGAQSLKSLADSPWIGVLHRRNNSTNAGSDHGFGARASAAGVIARLQRDVERSSARLLAGHLQRNDLGVIERVILMKAFTDYVSLADDYTTHRGIGTGQADALPREVQRALHEANVVFVHVS